MITQPRIEIIEINDKPENPILEEPVVPSDTEIIDFLMQLWKLDSSAEDYGVARLHQSLKTDHPLWVVSEKRLRKILKVNGLLQDINPEYAYTYIDQISSGSTPGLSEALPENVEEREMAEGKSSGLFATAGISEGTLIWQESPLVFILTLDILKLVKLGDRCAHCGGALPNRKDGANVKLGLDCNKCEAVWCSIKCKEADGAIHATLSHSTSKRLVNSTKWLELQDFCHEKDWNGLFAIAVIRSRILLDKTGILGPQWLSQAKVRQDVRVKSQVRSSFETSDGDESSWDSQVWAEGLEKLNACFVHEEDRLEYAEFLEYLGRFHLNEYENSIYLLLSRVNHDCAPNVRIESEKGAIRAYAIRDIVKDEELTVSYVNPSHGVIHRRRELREGYGFICNCAKCEAELKLQERRRSNSRSNSRSSVSGQRVKIKDLLEGGQEFELGVPEDVGKGRRKSVRFDEKVIAVS
ncbi:unnamed protein product [Kuraishia capsulata CBS 1993]|uniref:Histone-lysine N-methyltransferase SET5 n=1 Tax=Kuraishia capsulata CBS 1993 TaxID=1382522 RepID=W6MJG3_9ASCO|nr:uncharacterized protein KUCA_T00002648001 [Kuraishia capsulata CBS 1993]CDK26674.1 unnamed protein product [Kuraishia capsulata CBS 1993]